MSKSKIEKLGQVLRTLGEERLDEILKVFYQKMAQDILVGFFFAGKDLSRIVRHQKEFLLKSVGLIPEYRGKGPAEAHAKLPPILRGHFNRRLVLLQETLKEFNLAPEDAAAWVGFEKSFRKLVEHREDRRGH